MKKVIYTLLIAISSSLLFAACTDEEIAPSTQTNNGGELYADGVRK